MSKNPPMNEWSHPDDAFYPLRLGVSIPLSIYLFDEVELCSGFI